MHMPTFVACVVIMLGICGCPVDNRCAEEEPYYAGGGTDEVWRTLVDGRSRAEAGGDAPTFIVPEADAEFAADTPETFSWDSPLRLAISPQRYRGAANAPPSFLQRLAHALIPAAHAHLPPVTGDAYLLEIDVPGRGCPVAVVTTEVTHSFEKDQWQQVASAPGKELMAHLTSAYLTAGRITEGPFHADDVGFRVKE